ncbi:MAG: PKD domain-containing protein, partial [Bacteroidota bacterium]
MKKTQLPLLMLLFGLHTLWGQVDYNAHDFILPYAGPFRPGVNPGTAPPWTDEQMAEIAAGNPDRNIPGAGVKALRPLLSGEFVAEYGYDFKLGTYQYYDQLGLHDNTLIVGFPAAAQRDPNHYCPSAQSELFANLYTDIWDNGENGTPVNDDNYYALYLYQLVTRYGDYVRFWEIWNEPGFDYTGALGWFPRGAPGNWWDNDPNPCDYKLRAPIQHFVRLLRISYDIIKTLDPEAYVTLSGIGYPSFLDAVLRNTDNPIDGSPSPAYPLGGGAYFDVLGFHSYPHFDGSVKAWSDSLNGFLYTRHSDDAAAGLSKQKDIFQDVLHDYGYDGLQYPAKEWIVTECNIPRKTFGDFIGSELAQRNFVMKAYVESVLSDILQLHLYRLGEEGTWDEALGEFELMGLYQRLETTDVYHPEPVEAAIAYKTTSDLLFGQTYDPVRTADLQLPPTAKGAAFYDTEGRYTYVLWAMTTVDRSEAAAALYQLPDPLNRGHYWLRRWNFSRSQAHELSDGQAIALDATPLFLSETIFDTDRIAACTGQSITLRAFDWPGVDHWEWRMPKAQPSSAVGTTVNIQFDRAGEGEVVLEGRAANGAVLIRQGTSLTIESAPTADFEAQLSGPILRLHETASTNAQQYHWDFGDGQTSTAPNPQRVYPTSGNYPVSLTVSNSCGADQRTQTFAVTLPTTSRISQTANESVPAYEGFFRPAVNLGVYPPWRDEDLADIAAGNLDKGIEGLGVKAIRPVLYEEFLDFWGYDIRLETFQHYHNLGLEDNTLIVGFPAERHRDPNFYCPTHQSEHFANLYTDIWDDGENGTPVNDDNYYALYLYRVATLYGDQIKFWEIWNEPSFDYSSLNGWLPPGQRGNWWDKDPYPCDYKLRAPIQHFVRLLRISYEVIKTIDPDAFVTLSGVAFPSFLDAVLRNTDNPEDGSVNPTYPLQGGAYFDVMGFHSYPHFDGSTSYFDVDLGDWVYSRHSDAAADGLPRSQDNLEVVLHDYGYDGQTFPEKHWIVTEANLPRKAFGQFIGSDLAQRNYIIKTFVQSLVHNFLQLHLYKIAEDTGYEEAGFEFDLMGLYEKLSGTDPRTDGAVLTEAGIAYKSCSELLYGTVYDADRTNALQLPAGVRGAALRDVAGQYHYVLWAATHTDQSEVASASYTFPSSLSLSELTLRHWDFSISGITEQVDGQQLSLSATPIFLSENPTPLLPPVAAFRSRTRSGCAPLSLTFENLSEGAESYEWAFPGAQVASSTSAQPTVRYEQAGTYEVRLTVSNAAGQHTTSRSQYIEVEAPPLAGFDYQVNGPFAAFTITIQNDSTDYFWDFGDGFAFPANDPTHYYFFNGDYDVTLVARNECGADTLVRTVRIAAPTQAEFTWTRVNNCPPYELLFQDQSSASPSTWQWHFPGASPATSDQTNPTVFYPGPGDYPVTLIVDNGLARDTLHRVVSLAGPQPGQVQLRLCPGASTLVNGTVYDENNPQGTEVIPNGSVLGCDSLIEVRLDFYPPTIDTFYRQICAGTLPGAGTYTEVLINQWGCDSTVVTQLSEWPPAESEWRDTLCAGDSLWINGRVYHQERPQGQDTLLGASQWGCDSLLYIDLHFNATYQTLIYDTIAWGKNYPFGGEYYTESGTYRDSLTSLLACDSIVVLHLTVLDRNTALDPEWGQDVSFYAHPNPFRTTSRIHLEVGTPQPVQLELYDVRGRRVERLQPPSHLATGAYHWDLAATALPAGVYFCRLTLAEKQYSLR